MILSFRDKETQRLYEQEKSGKYAQIVRVVLRKLIQLDEAISFNDLAIPPGNRLETLKGNRSGQHSIRINDQYRICFIWNGNDAENVEICDYH